MIKTHRAGFVAALLLLSSVTLSAGVIVVPTDLTITKTDSVDPVAPGATMSYTLTVTNVSGNAANGVVVNDTLPVGTGWIVTNAPAFSGCTNPGLGNPGLVSCTLAGALNAGASVVVTITVAVDAVPPALLSNTATVSSTNPDDNPLDNSDTETTSTVVVANADVSVTKTAGAGPFTAGGNVSFTITVANSGPASAAGVTVTDTLPAGSTFVSASPSQGTCSGTGPVVCNVGTLASTATATIGVIVQSPATPGSLTNTATVSSSTSDPNAANNTATATATTATTTDVPTMSTWMLIALAISFGVAGTLMFRN